MASVQKSWKQYENSLNNYNKFVELNPTYADGIFIIQECTIEEILSSVLAFTNKL
jgi:hypothetical protein